MSALAGQLDTSSIPVQETTNYLVPSSGGTHAVQIEGTLSATPVYVDWNNFSQADFPFQPQGVFIDNTDGTGEVTIGICASVGGPSLWNVYCPAGSQVQSQFPAPNGQVAMITGDGEANLIFVDFPVLPNAGAVSITGGSVGISGQPIDVLPAVNNAGSPYQVQEIPPLASAPQYASGSSGTLTLTPMTTGQYLRKLVLSISANATLASAGVTTVTVSANGTQIFKQSVYVPASALDNAGSLWEVNLDFTEVGIAMGTGTLTAVLGTALTAGVLEANGFFA
jgi:hypothetical protein